MGFLTDFEVLMADKAFSESHNVQMAIEGISTNDKPPFLDTVLKSRNPISVRMDRSGCD